MSTVRSFLDISQRLCSDKGAMDNKKRYQMLKYILFVIYIMALSYFVFFAEMFGRTQHSVNFRYNFVLFKEIKRFIKYRRQLGVVNVFINVAGNVLAFVPFGIGLPMLTQGKAKFITVFLSTFAFSLTIELTQLLTKIGCCDVDDLLLNTLGGVLGYICYSFAHKLINKNEIARKDEK